MVNDDNADKAIRDYFPFYFSFKDALEELSDDERLFMYDSITNYAFWGKEPEPKTTATRMCWKLVKPLLEKSYRNYENGKKGGAPKGSRNNPNGRRGKLEGINRELTETNRELNNKDKDNDNDNDKDKDNDNDNDNVVVSDKPKPKPKMVRPSIEEVESYMKSLGAINAHELSEDFVNYYDSNGWKVGKTIMVRWKSAANRWFKNGNKYGKDFRYHSHTSTENNITKAQSFAIGKMAEQLVKRELG